MILKVVNVSDGPQTLRVDLRRARGVGNVATGQVLTGRPEDQNTLAEPEKVAPRALRLTGVGPTFVHAFPAHSVTVLRVKAR